MPKVNTSTLKGSRTSVTEINANFAAIAAEFDNCVSLDGEAPSVKTADFDMNNKDILDAGDIESDNLLVNGTEIIAPSTPAVLPTAYTRLTPINVGGTFGGGWVIPEGVEKIVLAYRRLISPGSSYITASLNTGSPSGYEGSHTSYRDDIGILPSMLGSTIALGASIENTDQIYGHWEFQKQRDTAWTFDGMLGASNSNRAHGAYGGIDHVAGRYIDYIQIAAPVTRFSSGTIYCKYM